MQMTFGSALTNLGREALRIVLPAWCVVCGRQLPWRDRIASCCTACWASLPAIALRQCRSCALPLTAEIEDPLCIPCSADPLPVRWSQAWGEYRDGLQSLLHAFKFERHDFLDAPLATLLEQAATGHGEGQFDVIVPVPMHRTRERKRGYNQAELLARALAARIGVACDPRLLVKKGEKQTQSTLARAQRAANVRGVFFATERAERRNVLLVDDICTTGETFRACAEVLLAAGAESVCAVAVAKAT